MRRRAGKTVGVSWSEAQGQYRKYVGYQLGRNGKPQPKCWYLGGDEREAVRRAVELVAEWSRLKAAGATLWPLQAASGDASENKKAKDDFVDANALRVSEVCKLFVDSYRRLAEAGQVSWSFVHSTEHRLYWVKQALGNHVPMASVGEREIQEAVLFLVRRPMARRRNHQTSEPRPLAIKTVVNCVRQMKAMLGWYFEMDGHAPRDPSLTLVLASKTTNHRTDGPKAAGLEDCESGQCFGGTEGLWSFDANACDHERGRRKSG